MSNPLQDPEWLHDLGRAGVEADAAIGAVLVAIPVLVCKRALGAFPAGDVILSQAQFGTLLSVGFPYF